MTDSKERTRQIIGKATDRIVVRFGLERSQARDLVEATMIILRTIAEDGGPMPPAGEVEAVRDNVHDHGFSRPKTPLHEVVLKKRSA